MDPVAEEPVFTVPQARAMEEADPQIRLELLDGVVYSMGRATPWHAVTTGALVRVVGTALGNRCRVASESLAVGTSAEDPSYVHPDVAVLCGPSRYHPEEPTVILNPKAVFEVLSPSTAVRDRNVKLPKYKRSESLQTIVYVEHSRREVTAYFRTREGWEEVVRNEGVLHLRGLDVDLDISALYDVGLEDGGP
jgi:Uma2 family endonuclease